MLGFAVGGKTKEGGLHAQSEKWMFSLNNGYYLNDNGAGWFSTQIHVINGDTVSMCIDTQELYLYLKVNGKETGLRRKIDINEQQKQNLYPCLDLNSPNDQISLI